MLFNGIHKILESCFFFGYFGHIPEQTRLKPWYKYRVLQRSVRIQKTQTTVHTIPRKLQICYAGYFGHFQAQSPKIGKFFEILDEGLSTSKKLKQSIKPFL